VQPLRLAVVALVLLPPQPPDRVKARATVSFFLGLRQAGVELRRHVKFIQELVRSFLDERVPRLLRCLAVNLQPFDRLQARADVRGLQLRVDDQSDAVIKRGALDTRSEPFEVGGDRVDARLLIGGDLALFLLRAGANLVNFRVRIGIAWSWRLSSLTCTRASMIFESRNARCIGSAHAW